MEETTKLIQKLRNREHISREEVGLTANNASASIEEAREINEKFEIINQAFLEACKYLQRNPPAELQDYSIEELNALAGAGSYEGGYKQWANYFINNAIKNSKHKK